MMESIFSRLQGLLEQLEALARNYLLGHAYFITGEYYERLFTTYFSVTGFLVALRSWQLFSLPPARKGTSARAFSRWCPLWR